ncbi:MAG TPA: phosphoglucosamine mutase [Thermoanaerobaculia bacterium]|nr:phosphoglucosamine mutase [Thermoanaerobaculia bacterium]
MRLFGTDGLRGKAGVFPLDDASARLVGLEAGKRSRGATGGRVVLGGDTRESTPALVAQLARGVSAAGCAVAYAGVIPTPAVADLVLALSAGAGISVSASHNPHEDNGIKIFGPDGRKWPDSDEERLEEILLAARAAAERSNEGASGRGGEGVNIPPSPTSPLSHSTDDLAEIYLSRLLRRIATPLGGIRIVLDAGNGAAFRVGPEALRRAGARVTTIADRPDGRNINAGCGALHPEAMAARTREAGAAMGVALDGDADRAIFADENGRVLDGDDVLWVVARDWKRRGLLADGGVVGTVMSNYGLEQSLGREGIAFHRAAVGDRNVARRMEETGASIGGETSGHILLPFSPAGDGIQTALLLASIASESGGALSRLATLRKAPQALRNVRVERRVAIEEVPDVSRAIARAERALDHRGRVFLRYSGTEPLLRILVEGSEGDEVAAIADELEADVRKALGAAVQVAGRRC